MRNLIGLTIVVTAATLAQQKPEPPKDSGGARDLFYFGATRKDQLPPLRKTALASKAAPDKQAPDKQAAARGRGPATVDPVVDSGAPHLGIRYTLLLMPKGGGVEAVDPDRNFRKGDCIAIEFESNRSGYLYVLAKESSGNWRPLFPSAELPDEANVIDPGQKVRTPKTACFEIDDPPGTETLFVVLSRAPRDISELYEGIKSPPATPATRADPVQLANAGRVNSAVEQMNKQFGTRDLVMRKPGNVAGESLEKSVYVVNASNKPSSTVVTKVEIRHR
jgi:hypothetical protein